MDMGNMLTPLVLCVAYGCCTRGVVYLHYNNRRFRWQPMDVCKSSAAERGASKRRAQGALPLQWVGAEPRA